MVPTVPDCFGLSGPAARETHRTTGRVCMHIAYPVLRPRAYRAVAGFEVDTIRNGFDTKVQLTQLNVLSGSVVTEVGAQCYRRLQVTTSEDLLRWL